MAFKFLIAMGAILTLLAVNCSNIPYCIFIERDSPLDTNYIYACVNYKSLPEDLPHALKTTVLKMKENVTITRLYTGALLNTGMVNLKELYLNHCGIEIIYRGAFQGGEKLFYLGLSNNRIGWLELNVFEDLKGLEILDLSGNPLKGFDSTVFPINLRRLDLTTPEVFKMREKLFANLTKLQKVYLNDIGSMSGLGLGLIEILIVVGGIVLVCGGVCLIYLFGRLTNRPVLPKRIYRMMPKRERKYEQNTVMVTAGVNSGLSSYPKEI